MVDPNEGQLMYSIYLSRTPDRDLAETVTMILLTKEKVSHGTRTAGPRECLKSQLPLF